MTLFATASSLLLLCGCFSTGLRAQASGSSAATALKDPPQDKHNPAKMETFQIPSHGAPLNALMYVAAGAGPHGTVVLLHGFPGNEKNLDLAQGFRRQGWNVLYFDYRGSWGTPGDFSFTHSIEDTEAALAYLRDPANANKLRVDSTKLVLMGHSMGGMIAAYVGAHDAKLLGVAIFSAADMAGHALVPADAPAAVAKATKAVVAKWLAAEGIAPLAGCTPESLAADLMAHPEYVFARNADGLKAVPMLIVTSDDGGAAPAEALARALEVNGNGELKLVHLATDHSFSDQRIALEQTLQGGLDYLKNR